MRRALIFLIALVALGAGTAQAQFYGPGDTVKIAFYATDSLKNPIAIDSAADSVWVRVWTDKSNAGTSDTVYFLRGLCDASTNTSLRTNPVLTIGGKTFQTFTFFKNAYALTNSSTTSGVYKYILFVKDQSTGLFQDYQGSFNYVYSNTTTTPFANWLDTLMAMSRWSMKTLAPDTTAAGYQKVDIYSVGATAQTARDIGASVLLSDGTGAGQIDLTSGTVQVGFINTDAITAAAVAGSAGLEIKDAIYGPVWRKGTVDSSTSLSDSTFISNSFVEGANFWYSYKIRFFGATAHSTSAVIRKTELTVNSKNRFYIYPKLVTAPALNDSFAIDLTSRADYGSQTLATSDSIAKHNQKMASILYSDTTKRLGFKGGAGDSALTPQGAGGASAADVWALSTATPAAGSYGAAFTRDTARTANVFDTVKLYDTPGHFIVTVNNIQNYLMRGAVATAGRADSTVTVAAITDSKNVWKYAVVTFLNGVDSGQTVIVKTSTKIGGGDSLNFFTKLTTLPGAGDSLIICLPQAYPALARLMTDSIGTSAQLIDDIWDEDTTGHKTAPNMGWAITQGGGDVTLAAGQFTKIGDTSAAKVLAFPADPLVTTASGQVLSVVVEIAPNVVNSSAMDLTAIQEIEAAIYAKILATTDTSLRIKLINGTGANPDTVLTRTASGSSNFTDAQRDTLLNRTLVTKDSVYAILDTLQNQDNWVSTAANLTKAIDSLNAILDTLQTYDAAGHLSVNVASVTDGAIDSIDFAASSKAMIAKHSDSGSAGGGSDTTTMKIMAANNPTLFYGPTASGAGSAAVSIYALDTSASPDDSIQNTKITVQNGSGIDVAGPATTDEHGRVDLAIDPGTYYVKAFSPPYTFLIKTIVITGNGSFNVEGYNTQATKTSWVYGNVTDWGGSPTRYAKVTFTFPEGINPTDSSIFLLRTVPVETASDGSFGVRLYKSSLLQNKQWTVTVEYQGQSALKRSFTVPDATSYRLRW